MLAAAALGSLNAIAALFVGHVVRGVPAEFGWFSYQPMPARYADYLPPHSPHHRWLVMAAVVAAFIVGNTLVVTTGLVVRRRFAR